MKKTSIKGGKLSLNKETLRNLSDENLAAVQGGFATAVCPKQTIAACDTNGRACLSTNFGNTKGGNAC